jgi:hypothetical protein
MSQSRRASFVVRVVQDRRGQVNGVIERVATGAKEAFSSTEVIGEVILRMLGHEGPLSRTGSSAPARGEKRPR